MLPRAQGCLLGQLTGDSLGSLVEFKTPREIKTLYPDGVRELKDGGVFDLLAGQPTDDSEMALTLAQAMIKRGWYNEDRVRSAYTSWLDSLPFDCGNTIAGALRGSRDQKSQGNGAMMRVSPLGIGYAPYIDEEHGFTLTRRRAATDAKITHPNKLCVDANMLYVAAIAEAINSPKEPRVIYDKIKTWAEQFDAHPALREAIDNARSSPPADYMTQMGWVLIAFQNALYQLLHAPNFTEAVVDTVMHGGDTDTNAAICGALLGAVYGVDEIPAQWKDAVLTCRPRAGDAGVKRPRPEWLWPVNAMELSEKLLDIRERAPMWADEELGGRRITKDGEIYTF